MFLKLRPRPQWHLNILWHPATQKCICTPYIFGIPSSNNKGDRSKSRSQWLKHNIWHSGTPRSIHTKFGISTLNYIGDRLRTDFSTTEASGQSCIDPETVCDTLQRQTVSTNRICNSFLKLYRRYALDIIFLELRQEVKMKVTVTRKQHMTLWDPLCICSPNVGFYQNNIRDMLTIKEIGYWHDVLEMRSDVKVTETIKQLATLCGPNVYLYPHIK